MNTTSEKKANKRTQKCTLNLPQITISFKNKKPMSEVQPVQHSIDAYNAIIQGFSQETIELQEQVVVLFLNRANKPIGLLPLSMGGLTGAICDIRLILSVALKVAATSIILAHNHPSGNMTPSMADKELTKKIGDAADLMDIKLVDHLIVSPEPGRFYSFADEGL